MAGDLGAERSTASDFGCSSRVNCPGALETRAMFVRSPQVKGQVCWKPSRDGFLEKGFKEFPDVLFLCKFSSFGLLVVGIPWEGLLVKSFMRIKASGAGAMPQALVLRKT